MLELEINRVLLYAIAFFKEFSRKNVFFHKSFKELSSCIADQKVENIF